jgi:hypothetical protein
MEKTMELKIIETGQYKIAELIADGVIITSEQDALDYMATAGYSGAGALIVHESQLPPEFFDLKTRLAGDILQKFSNYRMKLAIIGDFDKYESSSLQAFIRESNRGNLVFFVPDREAAIDRLGKAFR